MKKIDIDIDIATYQELQESYGGICLNCGEFRWEGCEPDAENYLCEECGENRVYGIEQALLCGEIEII
jgi:predicted RNA-binding Zn-ribbon protein involved in translation (DUF1610 family)